MVFILENLGLTLAISIVGVFYCPVFDAKNLTFIAHKKFIYRSK